jgi:pyruvate dehydrogenase E1 component alpha subunit
MHLSSDGIFVASGSIVGGMIPVATGAAWAKKLKNESGIVVCFLGDGATEEGSFGESLSFSSLQQLPILYVVHNNKLAVTTPVEDRHTYNICDVAKAYGLGTHDYIDYSAGLDVASKMVENVIGMVRKGKPQLIEMAVERKMVHCGVEVERELVHDVLYGYSVDESGIESEIQEAFEYARSAPTPTPTNDGRSVYAT